MRSLYPVMAMSTRPAYERAWEWTKDWIGSPGFYVVEVVGALVIGALIWAITGELDLGLGGLALGAIVAGPAAYLWRWRAISVEDRLRSVVGQVASAQDPSANLERYVEDRLDDLRALADRLEASTGSTETWQAWDRFKSEASTAAYGVGVYDTKLHDYVVATLNSADRKVHNMERKSPEAFREQADRVVKTLSDTPTLYHD